MSESRKTWQRLSNGLNCQITFKVKSWKGAIQINPQPEALVSMLSLHCKSSFLTFAIELSFLAGQVSLNELVSLR